MPMNIPCWTCLCAASILLASASFTTAQENEKPLVPPGLEKQLQQFIAQKEKLARRLAREEKKEQAPEVWEFFAAAQQADWPMLQEIYAVLRSRAYQYEGGSKDERLNRMVWQAVNESFGAFDEFWKGEEQYVTYFAREILRSIPRGSVYFGGTDPGRWLVTAFCKSHDGADPCFVLTQNALADSLYLQYLQTLFGGRLKIPTAAESQKAFTTYLADAKRRLDEGKLKPGENVFESEGRIQVSGQVAVMAINGLLAKTIFENNPSREFYVEESFPLDWMYPHLVPHGLIMKIERKPPVALSGALIDKDRAFWTRFVDSALGPWLTAETSVKQLCDFATTVFEKEDLSQFKGERRFVKNKPAQRTFSKLRSSIAGVYLWHSQNNAADAEKKRMLREAELALAQAFALCPYSPEAVMKYVQLLVQQGRKADALLLAQTAENINPADGSISSLAWELEQGRKD